MGSLKALIDSLERKEKLLPRLRLFLEEEQNRHGEGLFKREDVVIADAHMSIKTFKERIKEYNHGNHELEGEFFHPSALGGCLRADFFRRKKAPKDSAQGKREDLLRLHMIFETGTYVGVMFQNLCERAGVLTRREIPVVDRKRKILGHADGEVILDRIPYILEIKTINSRQFYEVKRAKKPKISHVRQILAYMKCLDRQWGLIVYLEKDRHSAMEFPVQFDESYYQRKVEKRIRRFFRQLRNNKLPGREGLSPASAPCCWCVYQQVCFGTSKLAKFKKSLHEDKKEN